MTNQKVIKPMQNIKNNQGFSIIEMIIVLLIMAILAVFVVAFGSQKLYYADQQANMVMSIFKEAKQRSITQRETMRVEINPITRTIHLIDENDPSNAKDDVELYAKRFGNPYDIVFDKAPNNIDSPPIESVPVPEMKTKTSLRYYEAVQAKAIPETAQANSETARANSETAQEKSARAIANNSKVATYRFLRNGNVVDAGLNAVGDNAGIIGATIYFWTPARTKNGNVSEDGQIIRAITLLGSMGTAKYWKCPIVDGRCSNWQK